MHRNIIVLPLVLLAACASPSTKKNKERQAAKTPDYEVATLQEAKLVSSVKLPAQLAAYEEVSIFPKVNGYVKDVLVDIGAEVKKGQLLMTLEAPELQQAAMQAKEKYMQTQSAYALSKEKYNRLMVAAETAGAISPFDLSSAKSSMLADSMLCNAEKTNWLMQQTMQAYLRVTAPFDGVITQRNVHPGALVSAVEKGTPMLELKNISHLRLQVDVPENISSALNNKDSISFTTSAMPGVVMKGEISRRSMNIESQLRAERVEADINNKKMLLSPGMYADVIVDANGSANAYAVPKSAVLTTTEGKFVLVNEDKNEVKRVDVSTGNQNADSVEVFGSLHAGEKIILNPDDGMLND